MHSRRLPPDAVRVRGALAFQSVISPERIAGREVSLLETSANRSGARPLVHGRRHDKGTLLIAGMSRIHVLIRPLSPGVMFGPREAGWATHEFGSSPR